MAPSPSRPHPASSDEATPPLREEHCPGDRCFQFGHPAGMIFQDAPGPPFLERRALEGQARAGSHSLGATHSVYIAFLSCLSTASCVPRQEWREFAHGLAECFQSPRSGCWDRCTMPHDCFGCGGPSRTA